MNKVYNYDAFKLTTEILDLNPELNVAWNYRRHIISDLLYGTNPQPFDWQKELLFTMAQLKKFPKVYWIWSHRTWCLRAIDDVGMWEAELLLVGKMLQLDARNYHGWAYRRYVVSQLEKMTGKSRVLSEFEYTTEKINANISNYSAWHQRATLFPQMFISRNQDSEAVAKLISSEVLYITNGIFTDADDQSVWMYLKWFIKAPFVVDYLSGKGQYYQMLQNFTESIKTINEDEIDFKAQDNAWCLKTLIFIENIVIDELHKDVSSMKKEYLEKLCKIDPLRKNRYISQLSGSPEVVN
ncbi:hypothetical protein ACO0QE_000438 [Hanseniaspora vineae]